MPDTVRDSGTRQDTFVIRVKLMGNSLGVWDKKTGGELDSDSVSYYPGNMENRQSLGGRVVPGNLTLQRLYDRQDDHDKINTLLNAVGKGSVTVTQHPLDIDGHPYVSKSIVWNGKLKRVHIPDVDSEATGPALIEIEVEVSGAPTAQ